MTYDNLCFFFLFLQNNVSSLTFWFSLYLLAPASDGLCLQRQKTVMKTGGEKHSIYREGAKHLCCEEEIAISGAGFV